MATKKRRITKGTEFRSVIADCSALWKVQGPQGKGAYTCVCVNEPIEYEGRKIDSDYAGEVRVFTRDQILQSLGWAEMFKSISDDTDNFWDKLSVGDIVHYCNGFDQFLRCEVAINSKGQKYAKALAMVGNWHKSDLPQRRPNGEIYFPYYPKKILFTEDNERNKEWIPNSSCTWEHPTCSYRKRSKLNPLTMEPIDLTVPDMDDDTKELARLWKLVDRVSEATNDRSNGPASILLHVQSIIDEK